DIQGLAGHHYQLLQDAVEDSRQWDVEEGEQTQLVKFFGNCSKRKHGIDYYPLERKAVVQAPTFEVDLTRFIISKMKYVFSTCEYELGLDSPTVWTIKSQRAVLCLKKSVVTTASGRELFLCVLAQSREEFLYVAKKISLVVPSLGLLQGLIIVLIAPVAEVDADAKHCRHRRIYRTPDDGSRRTVDMEVGVLSYQSDELDDFKGGGAKFTRVAEWETQQGNFMWLTDELSEKSSSDPSSEKSPSDPSSHTSVNTDNTDPSHIASSHIASHAGIATIPSLGFNRFHMHIKSIVDTHRAYQETRLLREGAEEPLFDDDMVLSLARHGVDEWDSFGHAYDYHDVFIFTLSLTEAHAASKSSSSAGGGVDDEMAAVFAERDGVEGQLQRYAIINRKPDCSTLIYGEFTNYLLIAGETCVTQSPRDVLEKYAELYAQKKHPRVALIITVLRQKGRPDNTPDEVLDSWGHIFQGGFLQNRSLWGDWGWLYRPNSSMRVVIPHYNTAPTDVVALRAYWERRISPPITFQGFIMAPSMELHIIPIPVWRFSALTMPSINGNQPQRWSDEAILRTFPHITLTSMQPDQPDRLAPYLHTGMAELARQELLSILFLMYRILEASSTESNSGSPPNEQPPSVREVLRRVREPDYDDFEDSYAWRSLRDTASVPASDPAAVPPPLSQPPLSPPPPSPPPLPRFTRTGVWEDLQSVKILSGPPLSDKDFLFMADQFSHRVKAQGQVLAASRVESRVRQRWQTRPQRPDHDYPVPSRDTALNWWDLRAEEDDYNIPTSLVDHRIDRFLALADLLSHVVWSGSWVWLTPDEINALHDHLAQSTDFESLPLPPLQSVITKLTDATSDATRALAAAAEEDMPDIATLDPDMR
ncbi:uncharacterized protein B0H18DRAFT_964989, partial [Fomitopsis serialis]|uniref:uncharacterized protein n=1 Tax=Fomitopsis serialis TaxID=139415 RepID=UPI002007F43F